MMGNTEIDSSTELLVQLTGRDGMSRSRKVLFTPEDSGPVRAGELKQGLLDVFGESSALLEADVPRDENRSYHLVGFDDAGQGTTFNDNENIDMELYRNFEITPRTTGGLIP